MKTVSAFTALAMMAGSTAFAQLSTLPPPSSDIGITVTPMNSPGADNSGVTHWEAPVGLMQYAVAGNGTQGPSPGNPDIYGRNWGTTASAGVWSALNQIDAEGGTVRAIFTGETAGWLNDFGFTYDGTPTNVGAESYTIFQDVQAAGASNVAFGDYVDIALGQGEAANFDFWLNGSDSMNASNPYPTDDGGVYTALRPENSSPFIGSGNVRWLVSPLMVNTWVESTSSYQDVATWLVSFEDWRLDDPYDTDFSDFFFAIQLYDREGNPFGNNPVPEPSTYGLMGAAALLGLVAWRRRKAAVAK